MKILFKKNKGFTLIEMIIVITIIGLLLVILTPLLKGYSEAVKKTQLRNDFNAVHDGVRSSLIAYNQEGDYFPWSQSDPFYSSSIPGVLLLTNGETLKWYTKLNEFFPKSASLNLQSVGSGYGSSTKVDEILALDFVNELPFTAESVYLTKATNTDSNYVYTNEKNEHFGLKIIFPLDDDPNTYTLIFVPKSTDKNDFAYILPEGDFPEHYPRLYELEAIVLVNEGYYSINGGPLVELTDDFY